MSNKAGVRIFGAIGGPWSLEINIITGTSNLLPGHSKHITCLLNTEKCELSIIVAKKYFFNTKNIFGTPKKGGRRDFFEIFFSKKCSLLCKYFLLFSIPHDILPKTHFLSI